MEIINANHKNLASVLMGKNLYFPWRSQRGVLINVRYQEWLTFVREHQAYLRYRNILSADNILKADATKKKRLFIYDISWAQYSEVVFSSNVGEDATLIIPQLDDGVTVTITDINKFREQLSIEEERKLHSQLIHMNNIYYSLFGDNSNGSVVLSEYGLSEWNDQLYSLCLYLQSKVSDSALENFNIDWRV